MASLMNSPKPTREVGQRSTNFADSYITRFTPAWSRPSVWSANHWRAWVFSQPVAVICREHLVSSLLSLDWKITPRDMKYKDELDGTIKYYTKLLERGGNNPEFSLDYSSLVEWIAGDLLDTPFGAAAEIGRRGDTPTGRVMWLKPLDSNTLYPSLNREFPVVQYYNGSEVVPFPNHAIARTYISPSSFMDRQGWGMPPPEKIYFAMSLLNRGDKYYANLLLDIPTAGLLDLGDIEKSDAESFVESFKTVMNDSEAGFRIPVLYEHNNPVNYIPFGKVPNDLMFDNITTKYASIVAAGYGVSLGDVGLNSGGATLAGEIRGDVRSQKNGKARIKSKMKYFFDQFLPDTMQFNFVDYDSEMNVAMGRARLASASAFRTFSDLKVFSPQELRSQAIADGLVSITLPDEVPPDSEFPEPEPVLGAFGKPVNTTTKKKKSPVEPEVIGNPKPPSSGGEGEFNARSLPEAKARVALNKLIECIPEIYEHLSAVGEDNLDVEKSRMREDSGLLEYITSISDILGDTPTERNQVFSLLSDALGEIVQSVFQNVEKSMFDNQAEMPYDSIVEDIISKYTQGDNNG